MIDLNKKMGFFEYKEYIAVPYQHHLNKGTWKVMVTKLLYDSDESIQESVMVLAKTAQEAAMSGIKQLQAVLLDREKFAQDLKESIAKQKKESTIIKKKDSKTNGKQPAKKVSGTK